MLKLFWALFPSCRPPAYQRGTGGFPDANLTREAAQILQGCGCASLAERVAVRWNRRLTTTAGLARYAQAEVSLNPFLKEFPAEIDRTSRY